MDQRKLRKQTGPAGSSRERRLDLLRIATSYLPRALKFERQERSLPMSKLPLVEYDLEDSSIIGWLRIKLSVPCLIMLLFGAITTEAIAAPSVTGVSGTVTTNGTLTISGTNFGTNALGMEWTGANIEAGTPGSLFSKTNWSGANDWSHVNYANDQAHSGSKSLKVIVDPANNWNGLITYTLPDPVNPSDKFYISWWARYVGGNTGQWKMLRLSGNNTVVDGAQELVLFNWLNSASQLVIDPGTGNDQTFYPGSSLYTIQGGTWYRQELIVTASSAGSTNGSATLNRYGGGAFNTYTTSAIKTHVNGGDTYRYVLFQNYMGNGLSGSPTVWLDDIYIANTPARVEVCNTSTWAARTHCEVQIPTAWSSTSITISGNPGSFPNGTGYLYVLDASGNVNASGQPVTIGSGTTLTLAPPNNLRFIP